MLESAWTSWRKSSRSGGTGNGGCVEVAWRKSSYSGGGNDDCVEMTAGADLVGVRDSKNVVGPMLAFSVDRWQAFLSNHR